MSAVSLWDKVLCGQYAWDEVKLWDENFKIVAIEYILGKIN
jgi:co-chaperonin GroES (HSP10)